MSFGVISVSAQARARQQFVAAILNITETTPYFWLDNPTDTTTAVGESLNGKVLTWDASAATLHSPLGLGYGRSFNGTTNYGETPDVADLTFVSGAMSGLALAKVTNTANARYLFSKYDGSSANEYRWLIGTTDLMQFIPYDQSVPIGPSRTTDTAITMGAWGLLGFTFADVAGGATAMAGVTLYENGLVKASTAAEQATYVTMEDKSSPFRIGAVSTTETGFMEGSMAMVLVCAKALTASEHWQIRKLCEWYFNFLV